MNNFANKAVTKEVDEEDKASDSFEAVNIVDKTLEDDTGDLADLAEPYEHSSPSDSPDQSPDRDQTESADKLAYDKMGGHLSSRVDGNGAMVSPRLDDVSSGSDMRELKLALGGMSDRSGNHQFIYNQDRNLYEAENVIFSDEGSNDSLNDRKP